MPTETDNRMDALTARAKDFADARMELLDRLGALEADMETLRRRRMRGLRNAVARFTSTGDELRSEIELASDLFESPRTRKIHGIRIGLMKQKGKLEFDDAAKVCELIRKHLPEQEATLIAKTEAPVKKALAGLSGSELKKLGVRVTADTDQVVTKATDSDLDKLINAWLSDEEVSA